MSTPCPDETTTPPRFEEALGSVAHDMRNSLLVIAWLTELIRTDGPAGSGNAGHLQMIERHVGRLTGLAEDVIEVVRAYARA